SIREITFYSEKPSGIIYIDNIRLTKGKDDDSWLTRGLSVKPLLAPPNNLIKNGDFELGFLYWGSWGQWDGGVYIFGSGTGEDAFSGEASAAIICQKEGRGGIYTSPSAFLNLKPGDYRLTFYAKGKGEGVKMFWILLKMAEGGPSLEEAIPENNRSPRFDVPSKWEKYEYQIRVLKEIGPLALYIFNVGRGTLYVDAVSLIREGGEIEREKIFPKRKASKVEIKGTQIYLNGKPFFPLGFYNAEPEDLAGTGFNLICRDPGPGTPGRNFLDRCERNGIMVSVNLEGVLRAHLPWKASEAIKPLLDHPAVFAWYTCDEPDHSQWTVPPPEMRLATELLHKTDPNHPTFTVVMPWADSNIYQYADTVDIIATDVYPISDYSREIIKVAKSTDVLKRAVKGEKPVFMVTQSTSEATPEEEYAMTYLAIIHGANGILYWNFPDARKNPQIWQTMLRIGKELQRLSPVLTSPESKRKIEVNNPNIHLLLKEYKGKLYVLTINSSKEAQRGIRFALPSLKGKKKAKVLFEDRIIEVKDGLWEDSYAGYERHLYEIGGG
ncbi:beta-galactosidase, partial [bacterium]|nr:beta-galactosidase [bacterium]